MPLKVSKDMVIALKLLFPGCLQIDYLESQNTDLKDSIVVRANENEELNKQLKAIQEKYAALVTTNENMHFELQSLRSTMQVQFQLS